LKRRNFIKKAGIASAGILSTNSLFSSISKSNISPNNTVNIGVIGTGSRGAGLTSMINRIEGINVIAASDTIPFRLESGIKKANTKAKGYKNYKALLDHKDVDAVIVATPFNTHSKIAIDALDAGKHVYCE